MVGRVIKPHQFNLLDLQHKLDSRMRYILMGNIGADAAIRPPCSTRAEYLKPMPMKLLPPNIWR